MRIIKKAKIFLRSFYLSSTIMFCLVFFALGTAKAYENIRLIGFGEYRSAIEFEDGTLKIFDLEIDLD